MVHESGKKQNEIRGPPRGESVAGHLNNPSCLSKRPRKRISLCVVKKTTKNQRRNQVEGGESWNLTKSNTKPNAETNSNNVVTRDKV